MSLYEYLYIFMFSLSLTLGAIIISSYLAQIDTGSIYTMIAMLSYSTDYVGGRLMVDNRGE